MRTLLLTALSASLIIRFPSSRGWTLNTPNNQLFVLLLGKNIHRLPSGEFVLVIRTHTSVI